MLRDECAALDRTNIAKFDRAGKTHEDVARALVTEGKPSWIKGWGEADEKWLSWGLIMHDSCPLGEAGVPKTTALLQHIRGLKVAALSLFRPGLLLPVHSHPELADEGLLTFHLGLEVAPDHCWLYADETFIREEAGKAIVFDGSKPHYAFNASDADRLILYCEFYPNKVRWVD